MAVVHCLKCGGGQYTRCSYGWGEEYLSAFAICELCRGTGRIEDAGPAAPRPGRLALVADSALATALLTLLIGLPLLGAWGARLAGR
jgi:hypothetical protein